MLFFSYSISSGKTPSHQENIFAKPCLDIQPSHKRCLRAPSPRGVEITDDKAFTLSWVEGLLQIVLQVDEFAGYAASPVTCITTSTYYIAEW